MDQSNPSHLSNHVQQPENRPLFAVGMSTWLLLTPLQKVEPFVDPMKKDLSPKECQCPRIHPTHHKAEVLVLFYSNPGTLHNHQASCTPSNFELLFRFSQVLPLGRNPFGPPKRRFGAFRVAPIFGSWGPTGIGGPCRPWSLAPSEAMGMEPQLVVIGRQGCGNDHFCDTTKRASQRPTPHIKRGFPCITEVGINPLIPQPCWQGNRIRNQGWETILRCHLQGTRIRFGGAMLGFRLFHPQHQALLLSHRWVDNWHQERPQRSFLQEKTTTDRPSDRPNLQLPTGADGATDPPAERANELFLRLRRPPKRAPPAPRDPRARWGASRTAPPWCGLHGKNRKERSPAAGAQYLDGLGKS